MALPIGKLPPSEQEDIKVFVSYSHKDTKYLNEFIKFFFLKLRETPQLLIKEDHVYYDHGRIAAGQEWGESILQALDESHYLIFLVSANSLISTYCFKNELAKALQKGKIIFPIILSYCPWEKQPVPNDPRNRNLGDFEALPKNNQSSLFPVSAWDDQNNAWDTVVKGLAKSMLEQNCLPKNKGESVPLNNLQGATSGPHPDINPLLPYCCNQHSIVDLFNERMEDWPPNTEENKSLIVFLRGVYDDNLPRFSDLLCSKYLYEWLDTHAEPLLESKAFIWPFPDIALDSKKNESKILRNLSRSLKGDPHMLKTRDDLAKHLTNMPGVCPIFTTLPLDTNKNIAKGLQVLLNLLEQFPPNTPLNRLVIFIHIENDELINKSDLIKTFKINGYQRSHIVDLMPLQEINEKDIRIWFRAYVDKKYPIKESDLIEKVFFDGTSYLLRMGRFDDRVTPILGLL